jgi:hypothetical protein
MSRRRQETLTSPSPQEAEHDELLLGPLWEEGDENMRKVSCKLSPSASGAIEFLQVLHERGQDMVADSIAELRVV